VGVRLEDSSKYVPLYKINEKMSSNGSAERSEGRHTALLLGERRVQYTPRLSPVHQRSVARLSAAHKALEAQAFAFPAVKGNTASRFQPLRSKINSMSINGLQ